MSSDGDRAVGPISAPLLFSGGFNWVFLIAICTAGILALCFLFYFNRLIAKVVAYAIRTWSWHKHRVYVDIDALQISLLAGRIFFKSLRYHAHNITVLVHDGHITWRYWLRMVQEAEVFQAKVDAQRSSVTETSETDGNVNGHGEKSSRPRNQSNSRAENASGRRAKELPCRVSVKISGVEVFIYNRSPSYDLIVAQMQKKAKSTGDEKTGKAQDRSQVHRSSGGNESCKTDSPGAKEDIAAPAKPEEGDGSGIPVFLRMLPIHFECKRAAATVGNEYTTSIVTSKVEKSAGTIDASHAGQLDLYKLLFGFDLERVEVALHPNRDFKKLQLEAVKQSSRATERGHLDATKFKLSRIFKQRLPSFISCLFGSTSDAGSLRTPSKGKSSHGRPRNSINEPGGWTGLARYLDETTEDEHERWKRVEYARVPSLVDLEKLQLRFHFDVPGKVPSEKTSARPVDDATLPGDVNGGTAPPNYGMDLFLYRGVVTYGPWADRQRAILQQSFFPTTYCDAEPAERVAPGRDRVWTVFKIFILLEEEVILRIPSREPSKDHKRGARAKAVDEPDFGGPNERNGSENEHRRGWRRNKKAELSSDAQPYGRLDVTAKPNSTIKYTMDMYPGRSGFSNSLDLELKGTEITSSVNNGLLCRTGAVRLNGDLSQPRRWNSVRDWPFKITVDELELFILRDHFFLMIDLVNDWSSGPPSDFFTFVPYIYRLQMLLRNFCIYLNVNDANIVNDPADFEKNDFLTLEGILDSTLDINMERYRPVRNWIQFDVVSTEMRMRMLSPSRSTFNLLLRDKQVAQLPRLTLKGSYSGHIDQKPGLTDTLRFDIVGTGFELKAHGFLFRQFINLKENYFGDYMHFKTLEEFQGAHEDLALANAKTASIPKPTAINELDVILCIAGENATILVPTNLYSSNRFLRLELPAANLDLRIVSYYLDLALQLTPIIVLTDDTSNSSGKIPLGNLRSSSTQLFIQHMSVEGHRAFGPPPDEPAYVSQWYVNVGAITGEGSPQFIHDVSMASRAFPFAFPDRENALPLRAPSIVSDATFVQVRTSTLRTWLHLDKVAFLFAADPIEVTVNDLADALFSQRIKCVIPKAKVACIDTDDLLRHRTSARNRRTARTYGLFETGVMISVVTRRVHFGEDKRNQQEHLRTADARTGRVPYLLQGNGADRLPGEGASALKPPAMQFPPFPTPIRSDAAASNASSVKSMFGARYAARPRPSRSSSSLSLSVTSARGIPRVALPGTRNGHKSQRSSSISPQRDDRSVASSAPPSQHRNSTRRRDAELSIEKRIARSAFPSSFARPGFPLDTIEPDETDVPEFIEVLQKSNASSGATSSLETGQDPGPDNTQAQHSVLISFTPGIRAHAEPHMGIILSQLLCEIAPRTPEEVFDAFQMDVLGTIQRDDPQDSQKQQGIMEFNLTLPGAVFQLLNPGPDGKPDDRLLVTVRSGEAFVRTTSEKTNTSTHSGRLVMHASVESVDAALCQHDPHATNEPALNAIIEEGSIYLAAASLCSVNMLLPALTVSVTGEHVEYLMNLVLRLLPIVEDIKSEFDEVLDTNRRRLVMLIYAVIENKAAVGDPTFLSRMTYILRAFPGHIRNHESWKVVSRFRNALENVPDKQLQDLRTQLHKPGVVAPRTAFLKAVDDWGRRHNWDVPNIQWTVAFQTLVGDERSQISQRLGGEAVRFCLSMEYVRLMIESATGTNELIVEGASVVIDRTPPKVPTGLMLSDEHTRIKTVVQLHAESVGFSLDWSSFGILERTLPLAANLQRALSSSKEAGNRLHDGSRERLLKHNIHVVASTDSCSIALQSVHLGLTLEVNGMQSSIVGYHADEATHEFSSSAILHAGSALTKLSGMGRPLCESSISTLSATVDLAPTACGPQGHRSMVSALAYEEVTIAVLEPLLGLIGIVDTVVQEEVSSILRLAGTCPLFDRKSEDGPVTSTKPPIKLQGALLARSSTAEISLMQGIKYHCELQATRVKVAPHPSQDDTWIADFDIGQNLHAFSHPVGHGQREPPTLKMPPVNGHLTAVVLPRVSSLSAMVTIEKIDVDATALRRLLRIFSRPDVQVSFAESQTKADEVQAHLRELGVRKLTKANHSPLGEAKTMVYDIQFALLGVQLETKTPWRQSNTVAVLKLGIGSLRALTSNRGNHEKCYTLIPDVSAQVHDISAEVHLDGDSKTQSYGRVALGVDVEFESRIDARSKLQRVLKIRSGGIRAAAVPETAAILVDVLHHIETKMKTLDLPSDLDHLRRLKIPKTNSVVRRLGAKQHDDADGTPSFFAEDLLSVQTTIQLLAIQVSWQVPPNYAINAHSTTPGLILTLDRVELATRGGRAARLMLNDLQVQLANPCDHIKNRAWNSAIMPDATFTVTYLRNDQTRSFALKATGKPLEVRLDSKFMFPVHAVHKSIEDSIAQFRSSAPAWETTPSARGSQASSFFDARRLASIVVEADFAGAQFYIQGAGPQDTGTNPTPPQRQQPKIRRGQYAPFATDGNLLEASLKAPGIALKLEYNSHKQRETHPSFSGEVRVHASTNRVLPSIIPLLVEVSNSVKEVMQGQQAATEQQPAPPMERSTQQRFFEDESIVNADPSALFGKTKVNLGLRMCRQEFGFTCQPISRVDAHAQLDDFYLTVSTIESHEHGHFFALSAMITTLNASLKHAYSREPTFSFDVNSVVFSAQNSRHLSGNSGISTILKINPTRTSINAKQLEDLLMFREIWLPLEIRNAKRPASSSSTPEDYFAERYRNLASSAVFPWNATVQIAELTIDLDLGQSMGKSSFTISNLWASQAKSVDWEQNLCVGMDDMAVVSTGRMSGFIKVVKLSVRTAIKWPARKELEKRPLIQASIGFERLRTKAAFDYQAFAFGDIGGFDFLMYNVREAQGSADRLVAVLDCSKTFVFCTSASAAQALGLYQAFDRLIQAKQAAYASSLKEIEKTLLRESTIRPTSCTPLLSGSIESNIAATKKTISLKTDVVVTMGAISCGVFPRTFFDSQILKLEANNIQARFAVDTDHNRVHSALSMSLGQLQVALASVKRVNAVPRALDISIDDLVGGAVNAKGGTISRVPKVVASMDTWQMLSSNRVDFIFKSLFDGKIDVGWNLSRINFIQGMWEVHSRALAGRLGKAMPESAVKITARPSTLSAATNTSDQKITAQVSLPQSKYEYHAIHPPIIDTPQLRDMGEATPPLEWIGLPRDRLPNVTHQIIIVSLLEVAKEVGEAYEKILGSS